MNCRNNCILIHASESQGFPWLFPFSWEQRKLGDFTGKVTEKNTGMSVTETFTNSAEFGVISQLDFFVNVNEYLSHVPMNI